MAPPSGGKGGAMGDARRADGERGTVLVAIGDDRFVVSAAQPLVFGRSAAAGIVGLDRNDMGISAKAGTVEFAWGVWWVVNHSRKRRLLIEAPGSVAPHPLECGDRYAITSQWLGVLVPGAISTHRIEILLPEATVSRLHVAETATSGTLTLDSVHLSDKDRRVLTALFAGYLRPFPRRDPRPLTYQEAAAILGPPWTRVTVRKQVERLKDRFAARGVYFDGSRANDALAEYLLDCGLLSPADLACLDGERPLP